jgi:capsular polysaccharide biosynthesis protein
MNLLLSSPSLDDLIRLLKAWRFWSLGALIGGLIGAAVFYVAPPPYRAHAVALVDFNLEQAWPQETDRQQFYYLERETRKLEEVVYSDIVLGGVVSLTPGMTRDELLGKISLSQPAEGGWNFYVDDTNPQRAASIATAWVTEFANQARSQIAGAKGLNAFIEVTVTRTASTPAERSLSISLYIFVGAVVFLAFGSIVVLFVKRPDRSSQNAVVRDGSEVRGS